MKLQSLVLERAKCGIFIVDSFTRGNTIGDCYKFILCKEGSTMALATIIDSLYFLLGGP